MTSKDGSLNILTNQKRVQIYKSRPHFCRVSEFTKTFKSYLKNGDKFLIDCCTQHISFIYGRKSKQMKNFRTAVLKK